MAADLAESSAVPFHLGLTEPIDEGTITGYPTVEGFFDPVEQIWRLPDGTLLTDPKVSEVLSEVYTETHSWISGAHIPDDVDIDSLS
jgi:hypothetical protein